ncbi:MAG: DUF1150 domain-containing protein [Bauldia sp.]|nr:MAG: DUF1150 domain-containing protein [Bauldia sp.]MBZ0228605.1 DUF1150 domain-containing protein [Bauldia sp.]
MPPANFAVLGGGKIAYIRTLESDEAKNLFPGLPPVEPGIKLWALLAADGTPIMLADSREAVVMNAHENDLETVSIH